MDKKSIPFIKMQGSGNDFILLDQRKLKWSSDQFKMWTPTLCHRRYGIGADGVIALAESQKAKYRMIYRNADGSKAGMCGNGGRCIARYAVELGFEATHRFQVGNEIYRASVDGSHVQLEFPISTRVKSLPGDLVEGYQVYPGTEHIVIPVAARMLKETEKLVSRGRDLRYHTHFQPQGTNVNFLHSETDDKLAIQTYERGVEGLTLACGTGAIASALVGHYIQQQSPGTYTYTVVPPGGKLQITFTFDKENDQYSNLKLGGPAHFVFQGTYTSH